MKVIFAEQQQRHYPTSFLSSGALTANPEQPARAEQLLAASLQCGLLQEQPVDYGNDVIASVHTDRYITFLQNIYTRWARIDGASQDVLPNVHPLTRQDGYPRSAVGQVGYHMYDGSCPISADTWQSARWSGMSAAHAAHQVMAGERACYALSRPPGHHASQDVAGGFCYLNNSAIAAQQLRNEYCRVAILDIDVHHGNGTQRIFYERDDVLTISIHADPVRFYPFFWGYADEVGSGAGRSCNINLPLPRGTSDAEYLETLDAALDAMARFGPDALVVALGLDAHESDPFQGMRITTAGFGSIGKTIGSVGLPTVMVQEGGYLSASLGSNLESFLDGFQAAP